MAVRVTVLLLYVVLGCCSSLECPTSFSPADNLDALGGAAINVYLDENDFDGGKSCKDGWGYLASYSTLS